MTPNINWSTRQYAPWVPARDAPMHIHATLTDNRFIARLKRTNWTLLSPPSAFDNRQSNLLHSPIRASCSANLLPHTPHCPELTQCQETKLTVKLYLIQLTTSSSRIFIDSFISTKSSLPPCFTSSPNPDIECTVHHRHSSIETIDRNGIYVFPKWQGNLDCIVTQQHLNHSRR